MHTIKVSIAKQNKKQQFSLFTKIHCTLFYQLQLTKVHILQYFRPKTSKEKNGIQTIPDLKKPSVSLNTHKMASVFPNINKFLPFDLVSYINQKIFNHTNKRYFM